MDFETMLKDLRGEVDRLNQAISVIEHLQETLPRTGHKARKQPTRPRSGGMAADSAFKPEPQR